MKRTANSNMQSPIFRPSRLMISTAVAVLLLSACTGANQFKKPRYAQDKRSLDAVACSAKAESLINRDIGGETTFAQANRDSLEVQFAAFDARKQRNRYYTDCLVQTGHDGAKSK